MSGQKGGILSVAGRFFKNGGNSFATVSAELGTNNNIPLIIKTNNVNRIWIENNGVVGIGAQATGLSTFTVKNGLLWAEFYDSTTNAGIAIRLDNDRPLDTYVIGTTQAVLNNFAQYAGIQFQDSTGNISFGGFPYQNDRFVFCLNPRDSVSGNKFSIQDGSHSIDAGGYINSRSAIYVTSNQQYLLGGFGVLKENSTDGDNKSYFIVKVHSGVSEISTLKVDSNGYVTSQTNTGENALLSGAYKKISAAYTAVPTDQTIEITAGTFTLDLYTCVGYKNREITIKNSNTGVITVDAFGAETIDGLATISLNHNQSHTLRSDGVSNWIII